MIDANRIRSERAERAALADLLRAAPPALRRHVGLHIDSVDGTLVASAARGANVVVNRAVGLGSAGLVRRSTLRALVRHYRHAGIQRYFIHVDPEAAPAEVQNWMEAEGLAPTRAWAKFVRSPGPPPSGEGELTVRRIGDDYADVFGRIAAAGFQLSPTWGPILAGLVALPEWHVYVGFDGSEPVGCAAMRIRGGTAWFDWAATRPEHRRRGCQRAVLARRIADAGALGCDLLVTATGVAAPGDPQHSFRNIERAGFCRSHVRANWAPATA